MVGTQAAQAVLERLVDPAARGTTLQQSLPHGGTALGGKNHAVASGAEGLAQQRLGLAEAVDVGGVEERDAGVESLPNETVGGALVDVAPSTEVRRPEAKDADRHAGGTKNSLFHGGLQSVWSLRCWNRARTARATSLAALCRCI